MCYLIDEIIDVVRFITGLAKDRFTVISPMYRVNIKTYDQKKEIILSSNMPMFG